MMGYGHMDECGIGTDCLVLEIQLLKGLKSSIFGSVEFYSILAIISITKKKFKNRLDDGN